MKYRLLIFVITILSFYPSVVLAQNRNLSTPMYIGSLLIDQVSTDKMASTCEYYNLSEAKGQGDYKNFSHPDGTEICFKVDEVEGRKYPEVKVVTRKEMKAIDKMLTEAGYVKTSDGYVKGSKFELRRTRCRVTSGSPHTLTFTKEYNSVE